ncbi:aspartate carbamoyltransferase catalytic subunit [Paenactinomyces guangxiensis]|uniref:Aspartate carbamoyltransferase n=1 Tax=Paenactinomyces guangxiensis TaxID=1490290 RepID=A0A7W1WQK2_9BACL|nr:aspartate carbamoyltransferase catalytic subunit [Paenactinomyces guangxiensis]MBA4494220.1 aspartate carbamoyltransferase catalytic subunit [Paenactinomyces guangxiensis]MBH8590716.1 aspartate carbamoyltransferase catalytic subunit [Paenactinomyces guangxiensis]
MATQPLIRSDHLFDTVELSKWELEQIMERAAFWEKNWRPGQAPFAGRFAANLFFEPSTRTRFSFEIAEKKLGLHVLNVNMEESSTTKGESLCDTVKTLSALGVEVVTVRHREPEAIQELLTEDTGCKIINAGAGKMAHPTQALLDLYTMKKHFGSLSGLKVAMIGDIKHSRVVRSNCWALGKFGVQVIFSGPESMRDHELEKIASYLPFEEAIREADVVMMLRVQLERHHEQLFVSAGEYFKNYGLSIERFQTMKPDAIIMHPGPVNRNVEISDELVEHPRSKIFAQKTNGVFIRMAVLERALGGVQR